jgi:hypothetical protein
VGWERLGRDVRVPFGAAAEGIMIVVCIHFIDGFPVKKLSLKRQPVPFKSLKEFNFNSTTSLAKQTNATSQATRSHLKL